MTLFRFKVTVAFTCNFCESLEQWEILFTGVPCNSFCKQFQKNLKKKNHLLLRLNTITKQKFVEIFIYFFANSQGRKLTRKLVFSEKKQTNKQKKSCKHARSLRSFWGISVFLFFQFDFINKKNHVMQLKIQHLEIGASFLNNRFAHEGS